MTLQFITVPSATVQPPKGLIVALHGWGANAQDLATLAPFMNLSEYQFVFPNAPFAHPYASSGRMWYGFPANYGFQTPLVNQPDLVTSRQQLTELLTSLPATTGIPSSRTLLAGFSQGGAMTLDVGLRLPLAGLMVLSGYLHSPPETRASQTPPVLMVHGRQDTVVPLRSAQQARNQLLTSGVRVEYQEFDMGHDIRPEVFKVMRQFIETVLPDQTNTR